MHWIDIVFIAIIIIFAIVGAVKGFFDSLLSLFASIAAVFLAFWASKPVAAFLNRLTDVNGFFEKVLLKAGVPSTGLAGNSLSKLASVCTIVLSMVLVYILIKLAVWLLSRLFDSVTANNTALSGMNRLFGLIFGAVKGFALVLIILGVTSIIGIIPSFSSKVDSFLLDSKVTRKTYNYVNEWVKEELTDKLQEFIDSIADPDEETPAPTITLDAVWNDAKAELAALTSEDITIVYTDAEDDKYNATVQVNKEYKVEDFTVYYVWEVVSLKDGETTIEDKATLNAETKYIDLTDLDSETEYTLTLKVYLTINVGEETRSTSATPQEFTFDIVHTVEA